MSPVAMSNQMTSFLSLFHLLLLDPLRLKLSILFGKNNRLTA